MDGIYRDYSACHICGGCHGTACRDALFQMGDVNRNKEKQAFEAEERLDELFDSAFMANEEPCLDWARIKFRLKEIATLKAEIERLRYALQSSAVSLKSVSGQRVFYGGDRVCQFCGTEHDAHHSAMCPKTNLSIVQEALTKQEE